MAENARTLKHNRYSSLVPSLISAVLQIMSAFSPLKPELVNSQEGVRWLRLLLPYWLVCVCVCQKNDQASSKTRALDSCFGLVGPHQ